MELVWPIKYLLLAVGVLGTAAIVTPVAVTQLPKSLESYKVSRKVQCHRNKAFALIVGNEVQVWSTGKEDLEQSNKNEHAEKGYIIAWDGSACEASAEQTR